MTRAAASSAETGVPFEGAAGHGAKDVPPLIESWPRMASEPFIHFTLLGALVFVVHRLIAPALDVPTIDVSAAKQRELVELFEQRQRRPPQDKEREQLVRR